MAKRVFLIVLDSFGIGEGPDADAFRDVGSNTLASIVKSPKYDTPNLQSLGLFHIDGVTCGDKTVTPIGSYGRMQESSMAKDTTAGHWEIAGLISKKPFPTYPDGFPDSILEAFTKATGRGVLCNKPFSGTDVILKYGQEHEKTGNLIVYTSADSVFQIAAHEEIVPLEDLYTYCRQAREILQGEHGVGRVIARPFTGTCPNYVRTPHRHDFSLIPPRNTMLDYLEEAGLATYGIGKIFDIFAGKGISHTQPILNNQDGMVKTLELMDTDFEGLCFVNLVDFDMLYGHRNDVDGYANAATEFDVQLGLFLDRMKKEDILIITADHGCDPGTPSTDHSREYTPMLAYGNQIKEDISIGTRSSFADIAATILDIFGLQCKIDGTSFWEEIKNNR